MDYGGTFVAESDGTNRDFVLWVAVPVSIVCPCSKAISTVIAHNQRGQLRPEVR